MANPSRIKSVLMDGTKPNYQDCIAEETTIVPGDLVKPSSDHSPNGVKLATEEGPAVAETQRLGIVEIERIRIDSTEMYDQSTAYGDNYHLLVHWLKEGDRILANMTNPAATRAVGIEMVVGTSGTIKKPDAEAAWDSYGRHKFSMVKAAVSGDTIGAVEYLGLGALDAS